MVNDSVLIVVDMLYDFIDGSLACANAGNAVDNTLEFIKKTRDEDLPVLFIRDHHPADHSSFTEYGGTWPVHCVAGTRGAAFSSALLSDKADAIVRKGMRRDCDSYSGFMEADRVRKTGLAGYLKERGVTFVAVCGLATDFCVSWTALDAAAAGFKTVVVTDASRAIDVAGSLAAARSAWKKAQVGEVTVSELLN